MTTRWPLGRAAFTEHLNELFFRDGMKIFSHSEGNNADLSKFPVPAELSLPGALCRMEQSFICENWVLKLCSAFFFFFLKLLLISFWNSADTMSGLWASCTSQDWSARSHLTWLMHKSARNVQYLYTFSNLALNNSPSKTKLMMLKSNMQIFALWQWHLQEAAQAPVPSVRTIRAHSSSSASPASPSLHNELPVTFTFFKYQLSNIYFESGPGLSRYFCPQELDTIPAQTLLQNSPSTS